MHAARLPRLFCHARLLPRGDLAGVRISVLLWRGRSVARLVDSVESVLIQLHAFHAALRNDSTALQLDTVANTGQHEMDVMGAQNDRSTTQQRAEEDVGEDMAPSVTVDSGEDVVKEHDGGRSVDGASESDSSSLAPTE